MAYYLQKWTRSWGEGGSVFCLISYFQVRQFSVLCSCLRLTYKIWPTAESRNLKTTPHSFLCFLLPQHYRPQRLGSERPSSWNRLRCFGRKRFRANRCRVPTHHGVLLPTGPRGDILRRHRKGGVLRPPVTLRDNRWRATSGVLHRCVPSAGRHPSPWWRTWRSWAAADPVYAVRNGHEGGSNRRLVRQDYAVLRRWRAVYGMSLTLQLNAIMHAACGLGHGSPTYCHGNAPFVTDDLSPVFT